MLRRSIVVLVGVVVVAAGSTAVISVSSGSPTPKGPTVRGMLDRLPLTFIENRGQVDPQANYYLEGAGASVYFTPNGVALSARLESGRPADLDMEFPGAEDVSPTAGGRTQATISDFGTGQEGLPTFSQVAYRNLWPGIELQFSGTASRLKYQFVVEPGTDPGRIAMTWDGSSGLAVNDQGQLEITTPSGTLIDDTPVSYQLVNGSRNEIATEYSVMGGKVGFELGAYDSTRPLVIDPALLLYAGYIGGSGSEHARGIAVDPSGNAYVTGATSSDQTTFPDGDPDSNDVFPVTGFDQVYNGGGDAYVAKINAAGTALVYAAYIGGSQFDGGRSIAVDDSGSAYVTGATASDQTTFPDGDDDTNDTFPAPGFDQVHNGSDDAFVAKLNPSGSALEYATYVGGAGSDRAQQIRVDGSGNAYVTGRTDSGETTFPDGTDSGGGPDAFDGIPGPDQTHNGFTDAFVAKVDPAGTALVYAGYIGGAQNDQGFGIVPLPSGNAAVAGWTDSGEASFPDGTDDGGDGNAFDGIPGPDLIYNGNADAFVAQINATGTALVSAGYIGGDNPDYGFGIGIDAQANAMVTGVTSSSETTFPDGDDDANDAFPVPGFDQTQNGSNDAFVAKLNPAGTALVYAGYIGGSSFETGFGIASDSTGNAYITGETGSDQTSFPDGDPDGNDAFPVPGPDQTFNGGTDAFVAKVNTAGTALVYAGYIGGLLGESGYEITVDSAGNAYVAGPTSSDQTTFPDGDDDANDLFPVPGFDQGYNGGSDDGFVAKIEAFPLPAPPPGPPPTPATCKGKSATVVGTTGGETLTGTSGRDVVAALGGNDRIKAQGGNDLVCAGDGRDTANGGGGRDTLLGQDGKDNLKGSVGKDTLNGGQGKDTCVGGSGDDKAPGCEKEKSIT